MFGPDTIVLFQFNHAQGFDCIVFLEEPLDIVIVTFWDDGTVTAI